MKRHAGFFAPRFVTWAAVAGVFGALGVLGIATEGFAQAKKGGGDAEIQQLRRRVGQLEEQLVDLRVVIGTLQSLAKAPAQGGPVDQSGYQGGGAGGNQGGRLTILETQIRALTAQVERMNARLKAMGGDGRQGGAPQGFGSTTVQPQTPRNGDRIGNFITKHVPPGQGRQSDEQGGDTGATQGQFDAAYNTWLQGEVRGAQEAFMRFLNAHPRHKLAGEAHYWLGETYYHQGRFKLAAKSFLTVSQSFEGSRLAPDSLYKLALALSKLGQTKAACSTLGELPQKYPQAPWGVLRKAAAYERRLGC